MLIKKGFIIVLLIISTISLGACQYIPNIERLTAPSEKDQLIKVIIQFTDEQTLTGYVKELGIEEQGRVYIGGSSLNYLYDKEGNIIAAYNYQRVLYIKVIDENEEQN